MITVDLKINCNCQLVATDNTNYCNLGYNIDDVIIVEGVTGIGYQISNLNDTCEQISKITRSTSNDLVALQSTINRILYPCGTDSNDDELIGTFDSIDSIFNDILDPC